MYQILLHLVRILRYRLWRSQCYAYPYNILEIFFPKIVPAFSLIQTVVTTAFFAYLIVPSIEVVVQTVQRNQFSPGMHLPMGCVYISVTLGLILGVIRGIQVLIDWIRTYILKRPATETVEGGVLK